jgi:two-component system CheB/CheR fusion protein
VNDDKLRERAESAVQRQDPDVPDWNEEIDVRSMIYEFEVCQTELELQNTELRRRESELNAALESFHTVFDLSPVALVTIDAEGAITNVNQAACHILRGTKEQVVGQPLASCVDERDCIPLNRTIRVALRDGTPAEVDVVLRHEDGAKLQVRARMARMECDGTQQLAVALVDLTPEIRHTEELAGEVQNRRQAERALDETRERLASIVQTAADPILTIDEYGVIESFNPAAERVFGYEASEILGEEGLMLVPPDDRTFFRRRLEEYQSGGLDVVGVDMEVTCQRNDGTTFPASLVISEMTVNGKQLLTGIIHDLTEKKELEEQLQHAQKMEAIGRLATGVAHDFNNLLMGISGCVELASRHVAFGSPAHTHLDDIRDAAKSGADIAHQLLAFARRQKSKTKRFPVDDVVRQVGRLLKTLVGEDVELEIDLRAPAGWIVADPAQFEQVLMNLAINARDSMPDGGILKIETSMFFDPEPPGGQKPGEFVRLRVKDTGCGISDEVADQVFEPFFTTKRPGRGTGLGLSTVHGIVQSMRGDVEFDSEVGVGTTFEIRIPMAMQSLGEETSTGEFIPAHGEIRPRTLVVEDDRLVRRTVIGYLRRLGHEVVEAATMEGALKAIEHLDKLDLLITDSILPDGDGTNVARQISRRLPGIGVIFMSAHGFDALVENSKVPKNARFLQKPFTREDLVPEIHKALKARVSDIARRKRPRPVVMIVDDHAPSRRALRASLEELGYTVLEAGSAADARRVGEDWEQAIDVILADVRLPDENGPRLARELAKEHPSASFVFMSGLPRELAAARFELPRGALFLEKPFELSLVADILEDLAPTPAN